MNEGASGRFFRLEWGVVGELPPLGLVGELWAPRRFSGFPVIGQEMQ